MSAPSRAKARATARPMPLSAPVISATEIRAAIRLNRYVDWNIGYQYYDYKEDPPQQTIYGLPAQNYSAHMPYTSVRIYLGRGKSDR